MNRHEIEGLMRRVSEQIRSVEERRRLSDPRVVALQRRYTPLYKRLMELQTRMDRIKDEARALGLSFEYSGADAGKLQIDRWRDEQHPSPLRVRFEALKTELRIARCGRTPEDIKRQQQVLRQIAKLADSAK